ncbi:3D domain-containing protein [Paenibacillus sp. J2TS4]|uniref:3D domain-containing protein n=1 Tax=Paenibacillus sp. J2TS4 TaxID=2807194 RepID=UPI001B290FE3|nr:3D domain-containing protein [Paenibacillus sp. J2TS4]GIP36322.1 hypothetical protein J2TS4_55320 [Paenibacillus sp. J2TS4]
MGAIQVENTHVKRSSSMSFALRWKHENLRLVTLTALASFALTFMFFMLLYGTATKSVSLVINGEEKTVQTKQWVLSKLLEEQAIPVDEYDRVSADLDTQIKNGDQFAIDHTQPVLVTADGETKTLYTTGKTVASALEDLNIFVGEVDKVIPAIDSELLAGTDIQIIRVTKQIEEQTVPVAFETVTQDDANLLKGKEQVVQEGKEGSKLVQTEKVFEDGQLVAQSVVGESIVEESVNKVIAIGVKNPVVALSAAPEGGEFIPDDGGPVQYNKVLNNVTLTAYTAGAESTGKSPGDEGYGITASGTTVTEGRTIAVDKSVIPLGWWVYIEGIGYRRAEDTGGAVKGNKIDVYFESESYANKFGVKRGYTVYVIGPKKPATD